MSAKADVEDLKLKVITNLSIVKQALLEKCADDQNVMDALVGMEFYVGVSLRILAKTNASKVRSEAITHEISARI